MDPCVLQSQTEAIDPLSLSLSLSRSLSLSLSPCALLLDASMWDWFTNYIPAAGKYLS